MYNAQKNLKKILNMNKLLIEIIQIIPDILWIVLAFVALNYLYKLLNKHVLPYMKSLSVYGVEIELLRTINSIIEIAEKHKEWKVDVSKKEKTNVINRVQKNYHLFHDTSILWFDDRPNTLSNEIRMFQQFGVKIDMISSLSDAISKLKTEKYTIIISDIKRESSEESGINTLKKIIDKGYTIPTIFYVGRLKSKGTPPHAFGITNKPNELLHLVIDILERTN